MVDDLKEFLGPVPYTVNNFSILPTQRIISGHSHNNKPPNQYKGVKQLLIYYYRV